MPLGRFNQEVRRFRRVRQLRFDGEDIVPTSGDQLVDEQLEERGVVRVVVQ